jgi:hypothetical protein
MGNKMGNGQWAIKWAMGNKILKDCISERKKALIISLTVLCLYAERC